MLAAAVTAGVLAGGGAAGQHSGASPTCSGEFGFDIVGTSKDDVLVGTAGPDRIDGGRGADRIYGADDAQRVWSWFGRRTADENGPPQRRPR